MVLRGGHIFDEFLCLVNCGLSLQTVNLKNLRQPINSLVGIFAREIV